MSTEADIALAAELAAKDERIAGLEADLEQMSNNWQRVFWLAKDFMAERDDARVARDLLVDMIGKVAGEGHLGDPQGGFRSIVRERDDLRATMRLHECKTCDGGGQLYPDDRKGAVNCHDCEGTGWDMSDKRRANDLAAQLAVVVEALRTTEKHAIKKNLHGKFICDLCRIADPHKQHFPECPFAVLASLPDRAKKYRDVVDAAKDHAEWVKRQKSRHITSVKVIEALAKLEETP